MEVLLSLWHGCPRIFVQRELLSATPLMIHKCYLQDIKFSGNILLYCQKFVFLPFSIGVMR